VPRKIVTDQLGSYPAAKAEITELAGVKHVFVKARARVNNRAENSHHCTTDDGCRKTCSMEYMHRGER
jgi:putative transposase